MYKIGDYVQVNNIDEPTIYNAQVVKICKDESDSNENRSTLYLLTDITNTFFYTTEDRMTGSRNDIEAKRRKVEISEKSNSTTSITTNETITSAKNWYDTGQLERFNIKFLPTMAFNEFFEQELPTKVADVVEILINVDWDRKPHEVTDPLHSELLTKAFIYQLYLSEAAVEDCVQTILKIFNLQAIRQNDAVFGKIDMVIYNDLQIPFYSSVIEIKSGGSCCLGKLLLYMSQLAACMISIAIQNSLILKEMHDKVFDYQHILGILHYGLTPIFYKVKITKEYLEAIQPLYETKNNAPASYSDIPQLVISQYSPIIEPYCDRELLMKKSRPIIFKCYESFKKLNEKYMNDKMSVLHENTQ